MPIGDWLDYNPVTGILSYFDGTALQPIVEAGTAPPSGLFSGVVNAVTNGVPGSFADALPGQHLTILADGDYLLHAQYTYLCLVAADQIETAIRLNGVDADPNVSTAGSSVWGAQVVPGVLDYRNGAIHHKAVGLVAGDDVTFSFAPILGGLGGTAALLTRSLSAVRVA